LVRVKVRVRGERETVILELIRIKVRVLGVREK
jgi:hypothetical protein